MRLRLAVFLASVVGAASPGLAQYSPQPPQSATVTATGSTRGRSLADHLGDTVSVRDFGAKCDGTTDDTAAFQSVFALTTPQTIRLPAGTCIHDGSPLAAASAISLVGDSRGSSTIKLMPSITMTGNLFSWGSGSGVIVRDLSIDLNGASAGATLRSAVALSGGGSGHRIDNVRISGAGSSRWLLIALQGVSDTTVSNSHLSFPTAYTTQNQAILVACTGGQALRIHIRRNTLVNSAIDVCAADSDIAENDISGWAFGAGVTSEMNTNSARLSITGNSIHDGATTNDVNSTASVGIENWAPDSIIASNQIWNNGDAGITLGAKRVHVYGNRIWNNGRRADGGKAPAIGARYADATYNASGAVINGNLAYDTGGGTQTYGYQDYSTSLTGIQLGMNAFSGASGAQNAMSALVPLSAEAFSAPTSSGVTVSLGTGTSGYTRGLHLTNGPATVHVSPKASAGELASQVQAGDALLSFNAGTVDSGGLVIAPWGTHGYGLRLGADGTATLNGSALLNSAAMASPPAIGSTTPATGAFTTLAGTTITGSTSLVAAGTNSVTIAGGASPRLTTLAGMELQVGAAVYVVNVGGGTRIGLTPKSAAGSTNPVVLANDGVLSFNAGTVDSGALVIAPWSNSSASPSIRMTPTLTTLKNAVALTLATPASSTAACTAGQIGADTGYVYVCTATNTWKRAALATW